MTELKEEFGPGRQFILLLVSLFLLLLYIVKPFKNNDYNNLCLAFAIFNFLWLVTIIIRFLYYNGGGLYKTSKGLIEMPYGLKCYFNEPGCERGDFSTYSIFHFVGYTLIGLFIPDCYIEILIISIACELLELGLGYPTKFLLDPAVNMAGYLTGSLLSWNK
jgi:hypothetical protein